jgi:hypothetical protein
MTHSFTVEDPLGNVKANGLASPDTTAVAIVDRRALTSVLTPSPRRRMIGGAIGSPASLRFLRATPTTEG